jgi:hypothetical protein
MGIHVQILTVLFVADPAAYRQRLTSEGVK